MRRIIAIIILSVVCLFTLACSGKYADPANQAERKRLFETDVAFSRASEEKGPAEAFNMYTADDAVQLPANAEPIIGRKAIYEGMKDMEGVTLTWTPVKADVAKSGDMGYTWGRYTVSRRGENNEVKIGYGKYLNVWKKQSDGTWKVLIDMGNASPPPADNALE